MIIKVRYKFILVSMFVTSSILGMQNATQSQSVPPSFFMASGFGYADQQRVIDKLDDVDVRLTNLEKRLLKGEISPKDAKEAIEDLQRQRAFFTKMKNALKEGVERGTQDAARSIVTTILTAPFKDFHGGIFKFFTLYLYKLGFGSLGLSWNILSNLAHRINGLCVPYTGALPEVRDRKRRGELTGDQLLEPIENNWVSVRDEILIKEIEHAVEFLKRYSSPYDQSYQDASYFSLKYHVGRLMHAFSTHDKKEVSDYVQYSIGYLVTLCGIIKNLNNFVEVEQKSNEVKKWLDAAMGAMEQIALWLNNGVRPANGIPFPKSNRQGTAQSSTQNVLDALLSGSAS
jgi:hypothetical protein